MFVKVTAENICLKGTVLYDLRTKKKECIYHKCEYNA